ncbi:MAG: hypothetical protein Q9203_005858 [Teloschistes exilis]
MATKSPGPHDKATAKLADLRDDVNALKRSNDEVTAAIESLEGWIKDDGDSHLPMLQFNLLDDFVEKLLAIDKAIPKSGPSKTLKTHKNGSLSEGGNNTNDHGTSAVRLIQSAEQISPKVLEAASKRATWPLQTKFFPYVKKLQGLRRHQRNNKAHRSSEVQFAKLLCHDLYKGTQVYYEWAGLLEFVYEMSIEDLAAGPK